MKQFIPSISLISFAFLTSQCGDTSTTEEKMKAKTPSDSTIVVAEKEEQPKPITYTWKTKKQKKEACFDPDKEDEDLTEFCSYREMEIGQVNMEDKAVEKRINDAIFRTAINGEKRISTIGEWLKAITLLEESGEAYTESVTCQLLDRGVNHIVISVSNDSYYYGAAHPSMQLTILNFDLRNGKIIQLSDIFKPGYGKPLKNLVEKQFIKQNGKSAWNFTPGNGDFELAEQFSITPQGLVFSYNQYEIGPYAAGMPEVIVSYNLISELFSKDSYLLEVVNPQMKK